MPSHLPRLGAALLLAGVLLSGLPQVNALPVPRTPDDEPSVQLSPTFMRLRLPLDAATHAALIKRDHGAAATKLAAMDRTKLSGDTVGDHAFLLAWSQLRAGRKTEAVKQLELLERAEHVPPVYLALTRAELLVADGRHAEAARALAEVPADAHLAPRAMLIRAQALRDAGSTAEARAVYQQMIDRPDPAEGSDLALVAMARMVGVGSPEAYPLLRRAWAVYGDEEGGREAAKLLSSYTTGPTWQEQSWRGDRAMNRGDNAGAIALLGPLMGKVTEPSADACRLWYAYGRSLFRANRVTEAANVLAPAGRKCVGHDEDRGAKALYLAGKSNERKKAWADAAVLYASIAELYPEHSYADDGLALAGIATQEAGDLAGAMKLWQKQAEKYPTGDLAGEGFWRLAWGAYLGGDTPGAIRWAEKALWEVPIAVDAPHVRGAAYWAARWRAWPDVAHPERLTDDPEARKQAANRLAALLQDHPHSYYALLAAARLKVLDPKALAAIPRPPRSPGPTPWVVRQAFLDDPAVSAALELMRLGLYTDARGELEAMDEQTWTPAEAAFINSMDWEWGNWLIAHDRFRGYLEQHPPELMGSQRERILHHAYPEKYWAEVKVAAKDYSYDPRMFHGLVREESNFNERIVSHAGARGLSQLMPATARGVAGWLGIKVTNDQLFDPATNLRIGARYMESLVKRYGGNPFLAMAGYNAGEGNVGKWLAEGMRPTDEFVEAIPYRETRRYVKRVSATWQTYHLLYDDGPAFPDLSAFNDKAVP